MNRLIYWVSVLVFTAYVLFLLCVFPAPSCDTDAECVNECLETCQSEELCNACYDVLMSQREYEELIAQDREGD